MALVAQGTPVADNLIFNTGTVMVGSTVLADITDLSITQDFSEKYLYVLGSILPKAIRRYDFKCGFKAKTASFNIALLSYLYGSSVVDGSGYDYSIVDGQQATIATLDVTAYIGINSTQPVQFQFSNALVKSAPVTLKMGDYSDMDLDVIATNVLLVDQATSQ